MTTEDDTRHPRPGCSPRGQEPFWRRGGALMPRITSQEAAQELLRRRAARRDPVAFLNILSPTILLVALKKSLP
jgi:hypothetical protein